MRRLTFWLLWIFVFSVPWEPFVTFPGIGTMSRLFGMLVVGVGLLTILAEGSFRRPGIIVCLALAFVLTALLSLFWTFSTDVTIGQVRTYLQLLGLLCVVWEFAGRTQKQESLMVAYCLGAYVSIADALRNFSSGMSAVRGEAAGRYAASNFDPNDFGLTLALAIPMAWYLFLTRRGIIRFMGAAYLALASLAILLSGSRAAFLSGIIAVSVVPLTLFRSSLRSWATVACTVLVGAGTAAMFVPQSTWNRIFSLRQEISEGSIGGRSVIWLAGLRVFQDHPVLGVGAGAFREAVQTLSSHNVFIAILVEQGIVGFCVFAVLLATCAGLVYSLSGLERIVWTAIACTWLAGVMSLDWQYSKVTWLLFALLAVRAAAHESPRPDVERAVRVGQSALALHRRVLLKRPI